MCGLSGIISKKNLSSDAIDNSIKSIKHRGPDDTIIFCSETHQLYSTDISHSFTQNNFPKLDNTIESKSWFAFNRLSIVDLSHNAMQPFVADNIIFMMNGEIYNYLELKNTYLSDTHFFSNSDSEIALKLYQKFGTDFVKLLQGMFTIVIYDTHKDVLQVWRDRFGIKPFYYTVENDNFIFSSEIKGILATNKITKEVNPTGLAYSMYLTTCPAPLTIYKNIYSLEPGHFLEFKRGNAKPTITSYWHLTYNKEENDISFKEFSDDILRICKEYNSGEVKKAIMISGGIDSGSLAYYMSKIDQDLQTIHIHDIYKKEFKFAKMNSTNAGLAFTSFEITEHPTNEEIQLFLHAEEEPNSTPEPALFLSKQAKKMGVKVLYNALGPDELFGGYGYFSKALQLKRFRYVIHPFFSRLYQKKYTSIITEINKYGIEIYPFISRRLHSWEEICDILQKNSYTIPEHPLSFLRNQILQVYPSFDTLPLLKKISYYDFFYYISSHHSLRSDQASMKYGIEMRFPYLEHTFVEKYFNQQNSFTGIEHKLKPMFSNYVKNILPEAVLKMKKCGFEIPVKNWIPNSPKQNLCKAWYKLGLKQIFSEINISKINKSAL